MNILATMTVLNEEDIISEVIEDIINQKIKPVVLDNGSSDETYEILKDYERKGRIILTQSSESGVKSNVIRRKLYDVALTYSPDWFVRIDADEFLETGQENKSLREGICEADNGGYNLIQFNRFDFFMTDDDEEASSVKKRLRYYSYQNDFQYRAWKYFPGINRDTISHFPLFPKEITYKIFPKKFVLRHYPFRSREQAEKKMSDRKEKLGDLIKPEGRHSHYYRILNQDYSGKTDHKLLTKYKEDNSWSFEKKFTPYIGPNQPTRNEIFSSGGKLRKDFKDYQELEILLSQTREQNKELRKKLEELENRNKQLWKINQDLKKRFPTR